MAITEIKKEPIEHENSVKYEETVLNGINNPPVNKVGLFVCVEIMAYIRSQIL